MFPVLQRGELVFVTVEKLFAEKVLGVLPTSKKGLTPKGSHYIDTVLQITTPRRCGTGV